MSCIYFETPCKKHNAVETTKNIFVEGAVENSQVTRWSKKFQLSCKNLNDNAMSSRPKYVDSKSVLQTIEENPTICTLRLLDKLEI